MQEIAELRRVMKLHLTAHSERMTELEKRFDELQSGHAARMADMYALADKMQRVFNRLIARLGRDAATDSKAEESPLSLRQRLRGS